MWIESGKLINFLPVVICRQFLVKLERKGVDCNKVVLVTEVSQSTLALV